MKKQVGHCEIESANKNNMRTTLKNIRTKIVIKSIKAGKMQCVWFLNHILAESCLLMTM